MSRFLRGLTSLVSGPAKPSAPVNGQSDDARSDAGPSTLTTPLVPLDGSPSVPPADTPRRAQRRALNAVVRATTQVALPMHVEPTAPPKVARPVPRSTVVLTETEKLRLQIMQVQLKLEGLSLYDGPIDGMMNHALIAGVRHFQTLKGMRDSGQLTTGTLTALGIHAVD